ncbi:hypothetical protein BOTNAR_0095g00290 [Botryotinia narcissicola]|uniref:Uncharacterized protein n=1 Tax=Botryotinia narcissicola TaxID=278944 RepID=A0A4Z1IQS0_9HELO|nr:hypothetical protein BOTNAR_0095g00290 [Botryotinia narcissicola]
MDLVSRRLIDQAALPRTGGFCSSLLTGTPESFFPSSTVRLTGNSRVTRYRAFHHEPIQLKRQYSPVEAAADLLSQSKKSHKH